MEQVGRYQILNELGRGAHGVVYKALDPAIGRTIAIKSIALGSINPADQQSVRQGILHEARLAGTLSHPNIVTVYDVLDSGDSAYIVMEFVDGKSLEEAIAATNNKGSGKLSRAAFVSIFKQVAQALDYAHRRGVIHRDVKPANIVLTNQRTGKELAGREELLAKIADFGVAKLVSQEVTQRLGGHASLIGTPSYMSPEQVQGKPVSGASDQFSLAVIVYEVLCGRKAFEAGTMEAVLYRIRNETETPVSSVNPALSPTVNKVMQRAMAKQPEQRFGTCSEFAGALEFALGDSGQWEPGSIGAAAANPAQALVMYDVEPAEAETGWGKRLALLAALCLAVGLAIVLIVRTNSGPAITTQILDAKNGPAAPPPSVQELKYDRHVPPPPLDLGPAKTDSGNAPTVANVPVPAARPQVPPNAANTQPAKTPPGQQPKHTATSGEVQLLTDPPGASVVVDGVRSCMSPCSLTLASGRHTLAATMFGYGTARRIFNVPGNPSIFMQLGRSQGVLVLSSEPSGASVSVDGKVMGSTPLTLRLPPGSHRVSVWDGSRWHDESVQISADAVDTRMFRF